MCNHDGRSRQFGPVTLKKEMGWLSTTTNTNDGAQAAAAAAAAAGGGGVPTPLVLPNLPSP
jgi:hypothetical protein